MQHNRSELLQRLTALEADPLGQVLLRVSLTSRLRDEELCEVIQEVLESMERVERNSGRFPSLVQDQAPETIPE